MLCTRAAALTQVQQPVGHRTSHRRPPYTRFLPAQDASGPARVHDAPNRRRLPDRPLPAPVPRFARGARTWRDARTSRYPSRDGSSRPYAPLTRKESTQ